MTVPRAVEEFARIAKTAVCFKDLIESTKDEDESIFFDDLQRKVAATAGYETARSLRSDRNYTYISPESSAHGEDEDFSIGVTLVACKPGGGPVLHSHDGTVETFFCVKGKFVVTASDEPDGARVFLDAYDLLSLPPKVMRTFKNIGDEDGLLLVMRSGRRDEFADINYPVDHGQRIVEKWGPAVKDAMEAEGARFTADLD